LRRLEPVRQAGSRERRVVKSRVALPRFGPPVQVFQFYAQHRGLQLIDSKVAADHRMKYFGFPPCTRSTRMLSARSASLVVNQAGVAEGARFLLGKNEKQPISADRAHAHAAVFGADGLRGILD